MTNLSRLYTFILSAATPTAHVPRFEEVIVEGSTLVYFVPIPVTTISLTVSGIEIGVFTFGCSCRDNSTTAYAAISFRPEIGSVKLSTPSLSISLIPIAVRVRPGIVLAGIGLLDGSQLVHHFVNIESVIGILLVDRESFRRL